MKEAIAHKALIENDAVIFGILIGLLAIIFYTSNSKSPFFQKFYKYVPMLLLCYFLPSLLNTFGLVNGEESKLYFVASRYLLPASLVLLTLSIDLNEIMKLGPKALIMFFTATVGVVFGGPIAIIIMSYFNPEVVSGEVWRGLTTVAGSWIGGGANQASMFEAFMINPEMSKLEVEAANNLYGVFVTIDVLVAEVWMFFLLLGVGRYHAIDKFFKADNSSIETLKNKMESFSLSIARNPSTTDIMVILGIVFGATAIGHFLAGIIGPYIKENFLFLHENFSLGSEFFWLVVVSTTIGVGLSFTKAKNYEGAGASKIGTVFIYILVATIGMKMDIRAIFDNGWLFMVGGLWMLFHVTLLFVVGLIIRAPFFFLAVGSKANIGGAASAPVIAAAFNPALAPVGVLLAVLGYALGTYGAMICGFLMKFVAP